MTKKKSLDEYERKRDFQRTSEPRGGKKKPDSKPFFVIQKHAARNLHYDFRLQVAGVLKSWAVPKGPTMDPGEKRLAMATEDHPLEYADFEGVIPEGEYGAGAVIVWDRGEYRNLRAENEEDGASMEKSLEEGKVEIWLAGEKIMGGYALIRTGKSKDERWLLIKKKDDQADARRNPTSSQPNSVLSGKSLEEIRKITPPSFSRSEKR
jgi:DNA ligase D-like protein (predicted 3'-phosphoesterase)